MSDPDAIFVKLTLVSDDELVRIGIIASDNEEEETERYNILESNDRNSSHSLSSAAEEQSQMLLIRIRVRITRYLSHHYKLLKNIFLLALFLAYMVYYGFAMAYSISSATALTVFTSLGMLVILSDWVSDNFGTQINVNILRPLKHLLQRHWSWIPW